MWPSFVNVNVEFSTHVVKCAVRKYACDVCDFTSQKESNIKIHTKRAHTGLIESPITLNQKLDDTNEVSGKAKNTRNINNLMSSEGESEKREERLSQDPGVLLPTETTSSGTTCSNDGNKIKQTVNAE